MASFITKEEPLIKQLVRTRAMHTREQSNSPTRRTSSRVPGNLRSLSQPPLRMPRAQSAVPVETYTLQFLPSSLVYPPAQPPTKKVSFSSVSQPDLTKFTISSPTISRCSSPSMTISGYGSPMTNMSPLSSPRAATPPTPTIGSFRATTPPNTNWGSYYTPPSAAHGGKFALLKVSQNVLRLIKFRYSEKVTKIPNFFFELEIQ